MKIFLLSIIILLWFGVYINQSYGFQQLMDGEFAWHSFQVIKVILDDEHEIVTAVNTNGNATSLRELMEREWGIGAINGAYFCPAESWYSRCGWGNTTTADRYYKGTVYSKYHPDTGGRWIFGFDSVGTFLFVQNNLGYVPGPITNTNKNRINDMYYGISNFPILIDKATVVDLEVYDNDIDSKMQASWTKTFICANEDGKEIYMGSIHDIDIYQFWPFLKEYFDCWYAINLDSGWSRAMIFNDRYVYGPGRNILDAFVIRKKWSATAADETKLAQAINWMFANKYTIFGTVDTFGGDSPILREQAAKFLTEFAIQHYPREANNTACNFNDLQWADKTLLEHIYKSCMFSLFKGYKNNFSPKDLITNGEILAVVTRIINPTIQQNTQGHRAENYWEYANQQQWTKWLSFAYWSTIENPATRGDIAILLHTIVQSQGKLPK